MPMTSCPNAPPMDTMTYRLRIDGDQIGFLNSLIESYDGIAVVRTLDASAGLLELWLPVEFESLVLELMHDLSTTVGLQYLYKASRRLSD